jgi:hypothetical protein
MSASPIQPSDKDRVLIFDTTCATASNAPARP